MRSHTAGTQPAYDLEAWRREIPILDRSIPMNNCSQAPQTLRTRRAAEVYLDSWNQRGMDWDAWIDEVERARAEFARLVGATPNDIAVFSSVSHAAAAVASALDPEGERRTILSTEAEFPTVGHVWLAHRRAGFAVDWVPVRDGALDLEDFHAHVNDRTLLLSATHGYYQTGFKLELEPVVALAREHGALSFVDAYQTLGTHALDVRALDVDFLAAGNLKFLMGVPGIAFLYVRPGLAERLEPAVTGWFGRANPFAFALTSLDWAPGARRFDTGTPPVPSAYIARAGMEIINDVGSARIQEWTETLSQRLVEGGIERGLELLGPNHAARRTPTATFRCADSHRVETLMRERGVLPSARGEAIRLAPHFYSSLDDVDRALDVLADVLTDGRTTVDSAASSAGLEADR